MDEKFSESRSDASHVLRERVQAARDRQQARFAGTPIACNAAIPGGEILRWCTFCDVAREKYKELVGQGIYSTRATDRMAKVARTIADLDGSDPVEVTHVEEAASFLCGSPLA